VAGIGTVEGLERGYRGTAKTIQKMHQCVVAGKLDPAMQKIATWIRARVPQDRRGRSRQLAEAIFQWVQQHKIFQRDQLQIEKLETPAEAFRPIIEARKAGAYDGPGLFAGDCDTMAIFVATLGGILGYEYAFETIKVDPNRPEEFSHVYTALLVDGKWYPLDASSDMARPGMRPNIPPKNLKQWREPLIEETVKKMKLNGKHKSNGKKNGMGDWVPPRPGYYPADYQGYGIPKFFPGRPELPPIDEGVFDVEIPQTPAIPRAEMEENVFYTKRVPVPPPTSRLPMDERNYMAAPQYMPPRPYYSRMTPYPLGWPYARQEQLVMDQPFVMDPSASYDFAVDTGEIIPIAGYEGLGQGETMLQEDAAKIEQQKEEASKSISETIEDALKGLIAAVPGMTSDYYEKKKLELAAKVQEAAAKTAEAQKQSFLAQMGIGFEAPWYKNPLTWLGIAAAGIGGYFLVIRPMMGGGRRRNPARRRKYSMRSRRRAA